MKKSIPGLIAAFVCLSLSCGSGNGDAGQPPAVDHFLGAWLITTITTLSCSGQLGQPKVSSGPMIFSAGSDADLQATTPFGCLFKFRVSGFKATLVNGPVSCSSTLEGEPIDYAFSSSTAISSDGHQLENASSGTATSGGAKCTFTIAGIAVR